MHKFLSILLFASLLLFVPQESSAQFRKDTGNPNISGIMSVPGTDVLFGLIDPSKIHMQHSLSMSYGAFGNNGMMLNTYMNILDYQISDKLMLRTNLGIMSSPYNTMGNDFYLNKPRLFGGAQLEYKMSENSRLLLQFQSQPGYYYRPGFGMYENSYLH